MSDTILDTEALTRRFRNITAVDTVTLSAKAGEVFGLLGSNGAGKTTTIKMLTTLLKPSSGEAYVAGLSIISQAVDVRRSIGYAIILLSTTVLIATGVRLYPALQRNMYPITGYTTLRQFCYMQALWLAHAQQPEFSQ